MFHEAAQAFMRGPRLAPSVGGVSTDFDYIIIGSGAGGSTLAYRLARSGRASVLVLEYGGADSDPLHQVPLAHFLTEADERYTYRYATEPPTGNQAGETWVRGRVAGGSTTVNGMIYSRGQQADFDHVAARTGSARWGWDSILRAYRAMEDHELGASGSRGAGGPFGVRASGPDGELADLVFGAAKPLGWRQAPDTNDGDDERIGITPTATKGGLRGSAGLAFLRPALRAGVTLETGVRAEQVLLSGGRATGVVAVRGGTAVEYRARREVVLACGTVESPLLLERSGIGQPALLRSLGIPVAVESPYVGERVTDHHMTLLQARFTRPLGDGPRLAAELASIAAEPPSGAPARLGPGNMPRGRAGYDFICYAKSDPVLPRPDLVGHVAGFTIDPAAGAVPTSVPGLLMAMYQLRPETAGSIHSSAAAWTPVIRSRFLETETDQRAAGASLRIMRELLGAVPLAEVIAGEDFPGDAVPSEAAVAYSRQAGAPGMHAVGSCAMGPAGDDVLDAELRVRGVSGLRVVDASALPFQVSANTAAPVMALAWLAADLLD